MSSTDNPYRPPTAPVADLPPGGDGAAFAAPGNRVDAGQGAAWIGEGWALFKAAPLMWIVAVLIFMGLQLALGALPLLGNIISILVGPFFMAGMLAFGNGVARNGEADLGDLFIGLKQKTGPLLTLALLYFLMVVAVVVVFLVGVFIMVGGASALSSGNPESMVQGLLAGGGAMGILVLVLAFFGVMMLVAAAYWYAPGLVLYTDLAPGAALKESFRTCLSNFIPFLVYGILALLVSLAGLLALVIGFFVVSMPVLMASYYASFRDLYGRKA